MAYTKLHATILDSSVWLEPAHVRLVWITMLATADQHGVVHASVGGLAHRARVTKEECSDAIARFLGPDPDSRDRTTGERIEEVPGGWLVLNHANYRDRQTREQSLTAARVAKHRAKHKERSDDSVTPRYVTDGNDGKRLSAYACADGIGSGEGEHEREDAPKSPKLTKAERSEHASDFVAFWNVYDHKGTSKVQAAKSWARIAPDAVLAAEIIKAATAYVASTPDKTYRKHPATWLNNRCWEVEQPKEPAKKFGNALVGGFDEKGKWHGVGRGPKNYSTPLDEDDPEHPKSILANQNAIRATKGLPPLSGVEEQKILNPGEF